MVGLVRRLLELLEAIVPEHLGRLRPLGTGAEALAAVYAELPAWNFSRDFLQRVPRHLLVARGEHLGWSDWGTPEAIERTLAALGVRAPWQASQMASA